MPLSHLGAIISSRRAANGAVVSDLLAGNNRAPRGPTRSSLDVNSEERYLPDRHIAEELTVRTP